jgi:hypothetical protein
MIIILSLSFGFQEEVLPEDFMHPEEDYSDDLAASSDEEQ